MSEIVEHMKFISRFFPKGDDPLKFPDCDGSVATDECDVVSVKFIYVGLGEKIRALKKSPSCCSSVDIFLSIDAKQHLALAFFYKT